MAAIVTTIVPLIVFLVFQRQFAGRRLTPAPAQGIDMPVSTNKPLRYRQIHLDFHTSEHIPGDRRGVRSGRCSSRRCKAAHVDSITIFAKCHHGWSYYPTKVGAPHPHLARPDLLGDMVTALKAADIECPIYISVQWDERNARIHPEWRVMSATNRYHHAMPPILRPASS